MKASYRMYGDIVSIIHESQSSESLPRNQGNTRPLVNRPRKAIDPLLSQAAFQATMSWTGVKPLHLKSFRLLARPSGMFLQRRRGASNLARQSSCGRDDTHIQPIPGS